MSKSLSEIAKQAYAQHDEQLVIVSGAIRTVRAAEVGIHTAEKKLSSAQRNLDHQKARARRLTLDAIAAGRALKASLDQ